MESLLGCFAVEKGAKPLELAETQTVTSAPLPPPAATSAALRSSNSKSSNFLDDEDDLEDISVNTPVKSEPLSASIASLLSPASEREPKRFSPSPLPFPVPRSPSFHMEFIILCDGYEMKPLGGADSSPSINFIMSC